MEIGERVLKENTAEIKRLNKRMDELTHSITSLSQALMLVKGGLNDRSEEEHEVLQVSNEPHAFSAKREV